MKLKHVGLIPDGNRRWAHQNQVDYFNAYKITMAKINNFIKTILDYGIPIISIYLLSKQNLSRNRSDLQAVVRAETHFVRDILPNTCVLKKCRVVWAGNHKVVPDQLGSNLNFLCNKTLKFDKARVNLLVGYDPFDEINFAFRATDTISINNLWVKNKVDCIIRTASNLPLLSNFLPLQSGYAQIIMVDKLFNDFSKEELIAVLEQAEKIKMQYGK